MRVLVCPDRFKGTFSAAAAARHLARGAKRAIPDARVTRIPMSDGGAGLLEALREAGVVSIRRCTVTGPLGAATRARFGVADSGRTIVVEAAEAAGLALVPPNRRDPLRATTFGVGELVRHAARVRPRPRTIVLGLGGTATNDGGIGFALAIGVRFHDARGREVRHVLERPVSADSSGIEPALRRVRVRIASDVTNPLAGPHGATRIFGPQKGVTLALSKTLDAALRRFGVVLAEACGRDVAVVPGAGAAGGLGAALMAFLDAEIVPGAKWVARQVGLMAAIARASFVLTGEGCIDAQTLDGKTVLRIARIAVTRGKPVLAVGGSLGPGALDLLGAGVNAIVGAATSDAMATGRDLEAAAEAVIRAWLDEQQGK